MQIYSWQNLTLEEQKAILARPKTLPDKALMEGVKKIITQVKNQGDEALLSLTAQYDGAQLNHLRVTEEEWLEAEKNVTSDNMTAIYYAVERIKTYHAAQKEQVPPVETVSGILCQRQARAIARVGLYIPGGSAPLISTVCMLAVPAKLAGCSERILCTPPDSQGRINPYVLAAAKACDVTQVYKLGGAQAIAAMAYGTQTVPKVDKIFGPGNIWVTTAKQQVAQDPEGAGIDMPAGPTELLIIADETANPEWVASDLLSQAEHGADSQVILVTPSSGLAQQVSEQVQLQKSKLTRRETIEKSLHHGRILVVDDLETAIAISNQYAPEHLILQVDNPNHYLPEIQHAGAVFVGEWAAESMGDYITGANHVLPTAGYTRYCSGLSLVDFMKFISVQWVSAHGFVVAARQAVRLAALEGLDGHEMALKRRLAELET